MKNLFPKLTGCVDKLKFETKLEKDNFDPPKDPPPGWKHPSSKKRAAMARKGAMQKLTKLSR